MANAKVNKTQNGDIMANIVVLRNAWGKRGQHTTIQPQKDRMGRYPECVRQVDPTTGKMIYLDADKKLSQEDFNALIPENHDIVISDGTVFDLNNPYRRNEWECIKNCRAIAESRDAVDENGNFLIDGTPDSRMYDSYGMTARYGAAEYYVERPGLEAKKKLTRKKLILQAQNYISNDTKGYDGWLRMAKVLGRNMSNQPAADVEEFLFSVAEKTPEKIIDLYTGGDLGLRFLLITAKEKGIIKKTQGVYFYGEVPLGGSDDAIIDWMKTSKNKQTLDILTKDAYSDMFVDE